MAGEVRYEVAIISAQILVHVALAEERRPAGAAVDLTEGRRDVLSTENIHVRVAQQGRQAVHDVEIREADNVHAVANILEQEITRGGWVGEDDGIKDRIRVEDIDRIQGNIAP